MKHTYRHLDVLCTTKNGNIELVRQMETGLLAVKKEVPGDLFLQYSRIRKIHHKNLVRIYELERMQDKCTVIEEYVDGETLDGILSQNGQLEWKTAARYLHALCGAVRALHKQDIIHRDINPNNIMVTRDGILKLCDYNISQIIGKNCAEEQTTVGTVGYAPPEQYGYGTTDVQSDIYAMGITAARMLGRTETGNSQSAGDGRGEDGDEAVFLKILSQMVSVDKTDRYETADMVYEDLEYLLYEDEKDWSILTFFSPAVRRGVYRGKPAATGLLYFVLCCTQCYVIGLGGCDRLAGRLLCIFAWLLFFDFLRISRRMFRLAASQRWFRYVIGFFLLLTVPFV